MLNISLTSEEVESLKKSLEAYIVELGMEIADTDRMDFREKLKKQKVILNRIINKLENKPE